MSVLSVEARGFAGPWSSVNGTRSLHVSEAKLLKFAENVGLRMAAKSASSTAHAVNLAAYKALAIKCAIDFSGSCLVRPREYDRMDPTDKANISYWTGMTFAALAAETLLSVPRLVHARDGTLVVLQRSGSRQMADLVGTDRGGNWHVIEAKGRQQVTEQDRKKWKDQAWSIARVNGTSPATWSYSVARVEDPYRVELVDPRPENSDFGEQIEFSDEDLISRYYGPLPEWLESDSTIQSSEETGPNGQVPAMRVRQAAIDHLGNRMVWFGLTTGALESIRRQRVPEWSEPVETEDLYVGADGVVVRLTSA